MDRIRSAGLTLRCRYRTETDWQEVPREIFTEHGFEWKQDGISLKLQLKEKENGYTYLLEENCAAKTLVQLFLDAGENGNKDAFHLIPCNIYGDNNIGHSRPDQFPFLTRKYPEAPFCSPFWSFRADRAAMPLSAMEYGAGCAGILVEPYTETKGIFQESSQKDGFYGILNPDGGSKETAQGAAADKLEKETEWIHNGVFAELPAICGISSGYRNDPVTFSDKMHPCAPTEELAGRAAVRGMIWIFPGKDRMTIHQMVREGYGLLHERPLYHRSFQEAAKAMADSFTHLNWERERRFYTDMDCKPPRRTKLSGWRSVYEIGWTGVSELAAPLIMTRELLGISDEKAYYGEAATGEQLIERILDSYNPKSGLFNNLLEPVEENGSVINGWWIYLGIAVDSHSAYTVGKAVHQILMTMDFLKGRGKEYPKRWLDGCLQVLDTIADLQREDGNCGYSYSAEEKKVVDWDGFAGCWFVPAFVYAYRLTGKKRYLECAKKAEDFYAGWVYRLNCYATPMDTCRAVDEEGNLAFIRGTRLLHEVTGEEKYKKDLEAGAEYEYLWRYAYRTRPECAPLNNGWNACGGSVTSISNPHIHPMGMLVNDDLRYLAGQTGDLYHMERAEDGDAWMMQNLEWYPEKMGYGQYGVMSERWCPSDGLVTETYSDGKPCASWLTYNLWAAANALEALDRRLLWENNLTEEIPNDHV